MRLSFLRPGQKDKPTARILLPRSGAGLVCATSADTGAIGGASPTGGGLAPWLSQGQAVPLHGLPPRPATP